MLETQNRESIISQRRTHRTWKCRNKYGNFERQENPGQGQLRWSLKINVARSQSQRAPGMTGIIPLEITRATCKILQGGWLRSGKIVRPFWILPADRRTCRRVCASGRWIRNTMSSLLDSTWSDLLLMLVMPATSESDPPEVTDVFWFLSMILPTSHPSHWQQANGPHAVGALHQGITRLICLQTPPRVLRWVLGFEICRRQGPHFRAHQQISRIWRGILDEGIPQCSRRINNPRHYKLNMQTLRPK